VPKRRYTAKEITSGATPHRITAMEDGDDDFLGWLKRNKLHAYYTALEEEG
jgi:hypothetical protein